MMRIAISTDCWLPQLNGITRTLYATARELRAMGHDVLVVTPDNFYSLPLPYGDSLVFPRYPKLAKLMRVFEPETVHIATQGPLGLCTRAWSWRHRIHVTTAFHTRFPEYAKIRYRIPEGVLYEYVRLFHGKSAPVLVPSRTLADQLRRRGVGNLRIWGRGVDLALYYPRSKTWRQYTRPIQLFVGRIAAEKNLEVFLRAATGGTKIIVGDGPQLAAARLNYPDAVFLGEMKGEELARCYSEADVFVFSSQLDTFGLVILEALASGVPVAALPSPHLLEIFEAHEVVAFDEDLAAAIRHALTIAPERCRQVATQFSWRACTDQFVRIIQDDRRKWSYIGSRSDRFSC